MSWMGAGEPSVSSAEKSKMSISVQKQCGNYDYQVK